MLWCYALFPTYVELSRLFNKYLMADCLRAVITNLFVYFLVRKRIIERDTFKVRTVQLSPLPNRIKWKLVLTSWQADKLLGMKHRSFVNAEFVVCSSSVRRLASLDHDYKPRCVNCFHSHWVKLYQLHGLQITKKGVSVLLKLSEKSLILKNPFVHIIRCKRYNFSQSFIFVVPIF